MTTELASDELKIQKEHVYDTLIATSINRVDSRKQLVGSGHTVNNKHKYELDKDSKGNITGLTVHGYGEKIKEDVRKFAEQFGDNELIDISNNPEYELSSKDMNKYNNGIRSEVQYYKTTGEDAKTGDSIIRLPYIKVFSNPQDITIQITDEAFKSDKFIKSITSLEKNLNIDDVKDHEKHLNIDDVKDHEKHLSGLPKEAEKLFDNILLTDKNGEITNPVQASKSIKDIEATFNEQLSLMKSKLNAEHNKDSAGLGEMTSKQLIDDIDSSKYHDEEEPDNKINDSTHNLGVVKNSQLSEDMEYNRKN